jgi:hypothetical protein
MVQDKDFLTFSEVAQQLGLSKSKLNADQRAGYRKSYMWSERTASPETTCGGGKTADSLLSEPLDTCADVDTLRKGVTDSG